MNSSCAGSNVASCMLLLEDLLANPSEGVQVGSRGMRTGAAEFSAAQILGCSASTASHSLADVTYLPQGFLNYSGNHSGPQSSAESVGCKDGLQPL